MRNYLILATLPLAACASNPKPVLPTAAAESSIEVCVVDTIAPGGMMTLSAIAVRATHDTVIVQPEGRVPIARAVAGPKVLAQATWITPKQPLTLTAATGRVRFLAANSVRTMAPGKIALLGMMRGLPIFGNPAETGAMRAEVEALSARGIDLEKALQQRASLRRQLARVRTLYIPTSLVGCTFQMFVRR